MRVLHISTRLILGGSQENTVLSCEGQAAAGHVVALAYGPIYGPEGSLLERVKRHSGIEAIEVGSMHRAVSPWRDWRCRRELSALIERWKPDVVHTHSSKAGILGRAAAWRAGVPCVVHTIHGLAFHPWASRLHNAAFIAAERWAARRCHAIVSVADAMTAQALAAGIGRPEQYSTIRSGIEVDPYLKPTGRRAELRARFGWGEDEVVVGTIARLAELKGHDDLLTALGTTLTGIPRLRLLWVGDGWWRERLLKRAQAEGHAQRIGLTGLVPPAEIPAWIEAMDVVAHPSYREGLPRVAVQACLAERPVVAYDIDGTREVCIDGVTGRLVKAGSVAALGQAIAELAIDAPTRQRMGAAGRARCREEYSAPLMVKRLLELYGQVLNRRSGSVPS